MAQVQAVTILHADLDAFYASVEQLLDRSLRGVADRCFATCSGGPQGPSSGRWPPTPIRAASRRHAGHRRWAPALADHPDDRQITLVAVSVSNLVGEPALQLELALELGDERNRPGTKAGASRWAVDKSIDAVRTRFGRCAVGYARTALGGEGRVPDEFRERAEHDPSARRPEK